MTWSDPYFGLFDWHSNWFIYKFYGHISHCNYEAIHVVATIFKLAIERETKLMDRHKSKASRYRDGY